MKASIAPEEGNKVRLSVEVDETEVQETIDEAVRALSKQVRIKGFRPGKVPRQVLVAHMGGPGAIRIEALREAIPDLYSQALSDTETDPIAAPEIDITTSSEEGPFGFDALVMVRPKVSIPGYQGLKAVIDRLEVTEEELQAHIDRLRDVDGELRQVTRPVQDGDFVTVDVKEMKPDGDDQGDQPDNLVTDYLYQVGSNKMTPNLDADILGASPGDVVQSKVSQDDQDSSLIEVTIKVIKEKILPELTDQWVKESTDYSDVEDMKTQLLASLEASKKQWVRNQAKNGAIGALVALIDDAEVPGEMIEATTEEQIRSMAENLSARGMTLGQYVEAMGQSPGQFIAGIRAGAERQVKADLALRAVAEAQNIEVGDTELDQELSEMAQGAAVGEQKKSSPKEIAALRKQLGLAGRLPALRFEVAKERALKWLLGQVEFVDEEGANVHIDFEDVEVEGEP